MSKKEGFHEDEMFTYGSSNCTYDNLFQPHGKEDTFNKIARNYIIVEGNIGKTIENAWYYFTHQDRVRLFSNNTVDSCFRVRLRFRCHFRTIRFHGDVIVAVANSFNGSGHHISLPLDITFTFVRDRLFVDSQVRYSYATEVCGMCRDWCDSTSWETGYKTVGNTGRNRQKEKHH